MNTETKFIIDPESGSIIKQTIKEDILSAEYNDGLLSQVAHFLTLVGASSNSDQKVCYHPSTGHSYVVFRDNGYHINSCFAPVDRKMKESVPVFTTDIEYINSLFPDLNPRLLVNRSVFWNAPNYIKFAWVFRMSILDIFGVSSNKKHRPKVNLFMQVTDQVGAVDYYLPPISNLSEEGQYCHGGNDGVVELERNEHGELDMLATVRQMTKSTNHNRDWQSNLRATCVRDLFTYSVETAKHMERPKDKVLDGIKSSLDVASDRTLLNVLKTTEPS
jgi:hypothetical protein